MKWRMENFIALAIALGLAAPLLYAAVVGSNGASL